MINGTSDPGELSIAAVTPDTAAQKLSPAEAKAIVDAAPALTPAQTMDPKGKTSLTF